MKVLICFLLPILAFAEQKFPGESLYHIESAWTNQEKKAIEIKEFSGDYIVLSMVYTGCAHACPLIIEKVRRVKSAVKSVLGYEPRGVLASFDVEKDTPSHLKSYMLKRKLSTKEWTMLSAPDDATSRELAAAIQLSYKKLDNGDFSHSNMVLLLDKNGVVLARTDSLSASEEVFVKALKENRK